MTEFDPIPLLNAIERENQVVNLFAAESGSRAWGFPSPDSDWDVRFIYARTTRWHVTLGNKRDVIERTIEPAIDVAGWDLRKAMGLLLRGNCAIREWMMSPIIYYEDMPIMTEVFQIAELVSARKAAFGHYSSLIHKVEKDYLKGDEVSLKKYLYAVRPALALRWLAEAGSEDAIAPMSIDHLVSTVPMSEAEMSAVLDLITRKRATSELGLGPRIEVLDAMIGTEKAKAFEAMEGMDNEPPPQEALERTNALLIQAAQAADLWYPE